MAIEWRYMDEDQPHHDLVAKSFGNYVDVIQHGCDSDEWDVTYDNVVVASRIKGREVARSLAEKHLSTQEGIITTLTNAARQVLLS